MLDTLTFGTIHPQILDVVWPDVERLLERSLETARGKFAMDDLRNSVESGELVLWLVVDGTTPIAAVTTRIIAYPQRHAMALDWVGGTRMNEWIDMVMDTIKRYAVDNGCVHLEGYGRKAWGRVLQKYGWKPEYIAYRMELVDG